MKPRWSFFFEKNPARDEHTNMPGTFGIFSGNGWCLVGIILRPNGASVYHGEFALIVWNYAFGWWWDEYPES